LSDAAEVSLRWPGRPATWLADDRRNRGASWCI